MKRMLKKAPNKAISALFRKAENPEQKSPKAEEPVPGTSASRTHELQEASAYQTRPV